MPPGTPSPPAYRASYANKSALDKNVSVLECLPYFYAIVGPATCFAGGHQKIYKQDLRKGDIKFRKFMRTAMGPPGGFNWSGPWIGKYLTNSASNCRPGDAWNLIGNFEIWKLRCEPAASLRHAEGLMIFPHFCKVS